MGEVDGNRYVGFGRVWGSDREGWPGPERVLPNGRGQIVIDVANCRGVLVGPRTVSAIVVPPLRAVGIELEGSGVYAMVGPQVVELVDDAIDLDALGMDGLVERWMECGARPEQLAGNAARWFGRFVPDHRVAIAERALRLGVPAREVASLVEMDRRRFVPAFRQQVGLNPKAYDRLARFQRALSDLRTQPGASAASIAYRHGFSDQPHLSREVRRLSLAGVAVIIVHQQALGNWWSRRGRGSLSSRIALAYPLARVFRTVVTLMSTRRTHPDRADPNRR